MEMIQNNKSRENKKKSRHTGSVQIVITKFQNLPNTVTRNVLISTGNTFLNPKFSRHWQPPDDAALDGACDWLLIVSDLFQPIRCATQMSEVLRNQHLNWRLLPLTVNISTSQIHFPSDKLSK